MDPQLQPGTASCSTREVVTDTLSTASRKIRFKSVYFLGGITPESERADQVLYALAKGELDADMANQILASLALLGKFKNIKIES
jgi:hypothetical protein